MMSRILILLTFCLLAYAQDYVSDMLEAINNARRQARVRPVCISERLLGRARQYAELQAARQQGGHYVDGRLPRDRYDVDRVTEALFEGYGESGAGRASTALPMMLQGRRTRRNLLNPYYTHVAVGRATGERDGQQFYYWVVVLTKSRERCGRAGQSVAEMIAPPERRKEIQHSYWEPIPGMGGMERVEEVERTMLDTVPRIDETDSYHAKHGQDMGLFNDQQV